MARLLLLETLHTEGLRQHRVEFFPFFVGLADLLDMEVAWWVLPVAAAERHVSARFVHALAPSLREPLAEALLAFAPDVVLTHDRLAPDSQAWLGALLPAARLVDLTRPPPSGPVTEALRVGEARTLLTGERGPAAEAEDYLTDRVSPRVCREFPFPLGFSPEVQPIRLLIEPLCRYRRSLADNAFFAGLDDETVRAHRGCSFCQRATLGDPSAPPRRLDPVTLALRQIRAHQAQAGGERLSFLAEEGRLTDLLDRFAEAILDADLSPTEIIGMTRVDTLLARRRPLEALLPRLDAGGHRLTLVSLGGENFSEVENERLNKGLSPAQLWEAFEMLEELTARFPRGLRVHDEGYFAAILFTPWTRPEDLRANLEAARRLGAGWLQRALGTRLQLWEGLPITALAARDGLLAERFGAAGDLAAVCLNSPEAREIPWRFADARAERLCAVLTRLERPQQAIFPETEALYLRVQETRRRLAAPLRDDLVALSLATLAAVEALGAEATNEEVLERLVSEHGAPARRAPLPPAPLPPPPPVPAGPLVTFVLWPKDLGEASGQRLHLAPEGARRPCLFTVGDRVVWHGEKPLDAAARQFLARLRAALGRPRLAEASLEDAALWERLAQALLAQASLAATHAVRVELR